LGAGYNFSYFPPGSYTVKINDDSGRGGTVLFEVYLLPGIPDNAGGIYTGTVIVGVQ
jgi:hypothetical protein